MIALPFNFQPTSVDVKTASYTIPSGKYAYVTVNVENGGSFSIDGSDALLSQSQVDGSVSAVNSSGVNTTLYTVPSGYRFEGQAYCGTSSNPTIGGTQISLSTTLTTIKAGSGQAIVAPTHTTMFLTGYAIREHEGETNATASFWLPSGAVINGSGTWKATVSLFNELT